MEEDNDEEGERDEEEDGELTYIQCTMCSLGSMFSFQPNKLRHILCLDIPFNIYLSQLVRLEGKHDF